MTIRETVLPPLELPARYPSRRVLAYLGRDAASPSERVDGDRAVLGVRLLGEPAALELRLGDGHARLAARSRRRLGPAARETAAATARRVLGLDADPRPFERRVLADPRLAPLVARRRGLRVPQTRDVWGGIVWVVAGQQVSLPVAYGMRRRLTAEHGTPVDGVVVPPAPERVADLGDAELRRLGFSRAKAAYLGAAAAAVAAGELDLEALRGAPADAVEARLLAVRGLGPWSVHYLMMRSLGLPDCLPAADVGLMRSLAGFFGLATRPDAAGVRELMAPFTPHRSLATFHFWCRLEDER